MKLTFHTDFALRLLMSLAVMEERLVTIEELARRHGLSRNHLMKVAQTLVGLGYVTGVRGRVGGLKLAKPAAAIRMGEVVRHLEDDTALVECLGNGPTTCILSGACLLTHTMGRAREAFFASLDEVTLADLVAPRILLRQRLGVGGQGDARGLAAIA
ncbi:MAG: BadM/Rrf2 family transcriptional regulator [Microvirga sp.]|jgi:Rrf2 family nitric oxide-sensitive transcriptional repressor|nr:BadM/Rrf2 family transcriptional regulator [Microvirga sp.]MCD6070784.1 BadM/Rrf2 family transcriptional regulator [Microvirga sp.]MDF2687727.1 BadM/Rrf2 family transcriptional regulator [Microvirga sp.]MDF2970667.1 BadM/Rrf2 family transcriptional regulator [Microvirga sp.]